MWGCGGRSDLAKLTEDNDFWSEDDALIGRGFISSVLC